MTQGTDWRAWNINIMEIKIMDAYEKKYNDLIARINAVKNTPKIGMKGKHHYDGYVETGIRDALDYIINPENEDEKIRTRLIALVEAFGQGKYKDEMLAYLERQKEHKPADVSEKIEELCSKYPLNKDVMSKETLSAYHQGLTFGATRIAEYLGEQRPAEWSEEDEQWLEAIIKDYENSLTKDKDHAAVIKIEIDFLKSLPERFSPQPHWKPSEEQMNVLKEAVFYFGNSWVSHKQEVLESLYNDLKKLL